MTTAVVYLAVGAALLLAVVGPQLLERYRVSAPMVLVALGMGVGLLPLPEGFSLSPIDGENRETVEHLTEFTVLVALMGVGLALDRPLDWRSRESRRAWSPTWRLLLIGMPLTIAGVALIAAGLLGIALPAALLLGAVLAPTDPVLASDVQVEGPRPDVEDEEHEVRFALTSEAGLNDGLAFPFVYAAIFLASIGDISAWGLRWLAWELVGKIVIGVLAGALLGRALARVVFSSRNLTLRLAEAGEPLFAVAALLAAYGLAELVGGYGFLAVFACGLAIRGYERTHTYHERMHDFVERLERLLTLVVLLLLGVALTNGLLSSLDWRGVVLALALVLVVRPLAGLVAFIGHRSLADRGLDHRERVVAAFFGVRGVGSIYYLAYAGGAASFGDLPWLWSTVAFTIVLSVILHGVTAGPVLTWLDGPQRSPRPPSRSEEGREAHPRRKSEEGEGAASIDSPS